MCIAIFKPKGKVIPQQTLATCFANNGDGAGFAVSDNGVLKMAKGFMTFEAFWDAWQHWQEFDAVIHFRIGTAGKKDEANCHPWAIDEHTVIAHNGTLRDYVEKDSERSDSGNFAAWFMGPLLEKLGADCFTDEWTQYLLHRVVGSGSKVIIFNKDAQFHIVNEEEGEWADGIWFSNASYKSVKNTNSASNTTDDTGKPSKHNRPNLQRVYVLPNDQEENPLSDEEIKQLCRRFGVSKAKHLKKKGHIRQIKKHVSDTYIKYGGDGKSALDKYWAEKEQVNRPNMV